MFFSVADPRLWRLRDRDTNSITSGLHHPFDQSKPKFFTVVAQTMSSSFASWVGLLAWLGVSLLATLSSGGEIFLDDVYPPVNASDNR